VAERVDPTTRLQSGQASLLTNWAGNVVYGAAQTATPATVDELRQIVVASTCAKAVGSGHSFRAIASTRGTLISMREFARIDSPGADGSVRVGAGVTYGDLARHLASNGRALANFASLPHISVGGAVATATHGSGPQNPALSSAVAALELVLADGSLRTIRRGDPEFDGAVVSLGCLGVVAAVTLETVAAFELSQYVFEAIPWPRTERELSALLRSGYSTSLFVSWARPNVEQVWVKSADPMEELCGVRPAASPRHPIDGADPSHTTEQLGVPGPAAERLPHFRFEGIPSAGDELQSEYAVGAVDAVAALRALRAIGPQLAPLLHVSEIRAVASDSFWLSPFYERDSITFHFTWKRSPAVAAAVALVETVLAPWQPRPHWAKLFTYSDEFLDAAFPRLDSFEQLRYRYDPGGKFRD